MTLSRFLLVALGTSAVSALAAPAPVAEYDFNGSLGSSVAGAPALGVVDPLGQSGFVTDTVGGASRSVWNFAGAAAGASQGGLTLDTSGLLANNGIYSLEMVFKFTDRDNAWRRIVDTDSRTTDSGFYVSPGDTLYVYPNGGGSTFTNNDYHDVFLVDNAGSVTFYLDGSAQATLTSSVMDIDASNTLYFFLDNLQGGGQNEWSAGSIASIRLYNEALSALPPPTVPPPVTVPAVPEPSTYGLLLIGLGVVGWAARRRR